MPHCQSPSVAPPPFSCRIFAVGAILSDSRRGHFGSPRPGTTWIPHRSTICSNTPHNSRCTPCHPALNAGSSKVSLAGTSLCRYFWIPRHSTVCSNTPHNSRCTPCHPALDAGSSPGQQTGSYPKMTLNNHNINIMLNAAMAKRPKQPAAIQPPAIPPPTASSPFPLWAYP